jgi:hypothetical protein
MRQELESDLAAGLVRGRISEFTCNRLSAVVYSIAEMFELQVTGRRLDGQHLGIFYQSVPIVVLPVRSELAQLRP